MQDKWRRCRDCILGEDAVKGRGVEYLPRVGKTAMDYEEYKKRTSFYNAVGRTLMALLGALFRKPVQIELSGDMSYIKESCDDLRTPLSFFIRRVAREVLSVGRYGVLVEMGSEGDERVRPYFVGYSAERIIDWEEENEVLRRVKINLTGEGSVGLSKVLVLELDERGDYRQKVYEREGGKEVLKKEVYPVKEGKRWGFVPFVMFFSGGFGDEYKSAPAFRLSECEFVAL